jgi:hypothetical protein
MTAVELSLSVMQQSINISIDEEMRCNLENLQINCRVCSSTFLQETRSSSTSTEAINNYLHEQLVQSLRGTGGPYVQSTEPSDPLQDRGPMIDLHPRRLPNSRIAQCT